MRAGSELTRSLRKAKKQHRRQLCRTRTWLDYGCPKSNFLFFFFFFKQKTIRADTLYTSHLSTLILLVVSLKLIQLSIIFLPFENNYLYLGGFSPVVISVATTESGNRTSRVCS